MKNNLMFIGYTVSICFVSGILTICLLYNELVNIINPMFRLSALQIIMFALAGAVGNLIGLITLTSNMQESNKNIKGGKKNLAHN